MLPAASVAPSLALGDLLLLALQAQDRCVAPGPPEAVVADAVRVVPLHRAAAARAFFARQPLAPQEGDDHVGEVLLLVADQRQPVRREVAGELIEQVLAGVAVLRLVQLCRGGDPVRDLVRQLRQLLRLRTYRKPHYIYQDMWKKRRI